VADEAIQLCLDHGVNHIDIAPSYGEAELRTGPWMPKIRDRVFLACKTTRRTKDDAARELRESLKRLQTDRFDLYQLHSIGDTEQLDLALDSGGAIEALTEARDEGLTKYLGITGHGLQAPATHAEALRRFDFDTVLTPMNPILLGNKHYRQDWEDLLGLVREKDVGLMVIKAVAQEPWGKRDRTYTTWYKPFETQKAIDRSVRYVLFQEITGLASTGDVTLLPRVIDAAERFTPMSEAEQAETIEATRKRKPIFEA
jgi:aryl-alcohol dehydrogenase-like predicted oxidoreductase